jgi:hypothetical protein
MTFQLHALEISLSAREGAAAAAAKAATGAVAATFAAAAGGGLASRLIFRSPLFLHSRPLRVVFDLFSKGCAKRVKTTHARSLQTS